MNALLFLGSADFALSENNLLCRKTNGLLLVFFYSTNCPHCGPARTIFNMVASQFMQGGCKFGMINVTQNPGIAQMAKSSKTPIRYVPFIMAFFNSSPLAIYSSAITQPNLVQFVQRCYGAIKEKVDAFGSVRKDEDEIPAFTTGHPVCEDGVCYLSYDSAYAKPTK